MDEIEITMTPSKELMVATEELRAMVDKLDIPTERKRELHHGISVMYTRAWETLPGNK
jgi:hypothetical protein